jgi:hypothetical protein
VCIKYVENKLAKALPSDISLLLGKTDMYKYSRPDWNCICDPPDFIAGRGQNSLTGNSKIAVLQTPYQNQLAWLRSVRLAMFATALTGRKNIATNEPD